MGGGGGYWHIDSSRLEAMMRTLEVAPTSRLTNRKIIDHMTEQPDEKPASVVDEADAADGRSSSLV